jgi:hypothetical protein
VRLGILPTCQPGNIEEGEEEEEVEVIEITEHRALRCWSKKSLWKTGRSFEAMHSTTEYQLGWS